ncbi:phage holin family protein [Candidatus Sulfidibacterium hydrothermale]|uniref:phage holin family protein n=1 Tax=Candidatus Sulfidibacterium hydrothermale TaxID=2875962 RepID=UPI0021D4070E|nr:phage holin family protein [Candidatus Sulfidibacterium hydrothermale]
MMYSILKFLSTVVSILIISALLPGVHIRGKSFWTAALIAVVLAVLNFLVYPFMLIITLPITLLTFGLFLLVINAFIIQLAAWMVPDFQVDNFWWALLFSILLSLVTLFFEMVLFPVSIFS